MPYTVFATTIGINTISGLTAENVQQGLEQVNGTAQWAAGAAGTADAKAVNAQSKADQAHGIATDASDKAYAAKGTLDNYVAPLTGKMDAEMTQVFTALGMTRALSCCCTGAFRGAIPRPLIEAFFVSSMPVSIMLGLFA